MNFGDSNNTISIVLKWHKGPSNFIQQYCKNPIQVYVLQDFKNDFKIIGRGLKLPSWHKKKINFDRLQNKRDLKSNVC